MAVQQRWGPVTLLDPYMSTNTQSASFNTRLYDISQFSKYSYQIVITSASSLNITAKLQGSNNAEEHLINTGPGQIPTLTSTGDWVDVANSSQTFTTNTTYIWDNLVTAVQSTRLVITFTGGSAKFQVYAFAKI